MISKQGYGKDASFIKRGGVIGVSNPEISEKSNENPEISEEKNENLGSRNEKLKNLGIFSNYLGWG